MPDGSPCAAHPEAGVATCPHCGTFVCDGCVTRYPWGAFACRDCTDRGRARFSLSWQQQFSLRGWWRVFTAVLLQPRALFSHFPELSPWRAFAFDAFALVLNVLASVAMGRVSEIAGVLITPCAAAAVYIALRMSTPQAEYRTVLAALWLLDGTYNVLLFPFAFMDEAAVNALPAPVVVLLVTAYLALYVRALWWLARKRLRVRAGAAVLAASAWILVSITGSVMTAETRADDSTEMLYGPAGFAPER